MKTLVIINGVTGAIGTAALARFSREDNITIYGLSRKANSFSSFEINGHLPTSTLICSIGDVTDKENCAQFVKSISNEAFNKIIYIHAVGFYPFEIDEKGNPKVQNDNDGDGIDDRVMSLSYDAFFAMVDALRATAKPVSTIILGSVSDKHMPVVHKSWWTVMGKIKEEANRIISEDKNINFFVLNISSVICPHEILTRPFVFQNTNANPKFWLMPHEVAEEIASLTLSEHHQGYIEQDLFHSADYHLDGYYSDEKFTDRKKSELGI